jgi:hypothetical protein
MKPALAHNMYFVQVRGDLLFIGTQPGAMNRDQALNLAAYLVLVSRVLPGDIELKDIIEAASGRI